LVGPGLLLVHGVHLSAGEVALLARRGATLALCLRSNLWIGGEGPPIDALRRAGVPLALGTDSLASNDDLSVLAEVVAWARHRPDLPRGWLWRLATVGGADALGASHLGRLAPGASPGVLQVDLDDLHDLGAGPPPACRFLIPPSDPEETWPTPW
jgi:cytosine/adenosine deaminase-related metal-dependent hydrolase